MFINPGAAGRGPTKHRVFEKDLFAAAKPERQNFTERLTPFARERGVSPCQTIDSEDATLRVISTPVNARGIHKEEKRNHWSDH